MDFGTALLIIVGVAIVVALLSFLGSGSIYGQLGRGDFSTEEPDAAPGPPPGSAGARAEAQEEIRQMVEAKSARRVARGEAPLDVDAEIASLSAPPTPSADPALTEEIRQLVVARNERRMRRGEEPLDVDAEVARELDRLG